MLAISSREVMSLAFIARPCACRAWRRTSRARRMHAYEQALVDVQRREEADLLAARAEDRHVAHLVRPAREGVPRPGDQAVGAEQLARGLHVQIDDGGDGCRGFRAHFSLLPRTA